MKKTPSFPTNLATAGSILFFLLLSAVCVLPPNPADDPVNSEVTFLLPDSAAKTFTVQEGDTIIFGASIRYPQHIDSLIFIVGEDTIATMGGQFADTVWFRLGVKNYGIKEVSIIAVKTDDTRVPIHTIIALRPFTTLPTTDRCEILKVGSSITETIRNVSKDATLKRTICLEEGQYEKKTVGIKGTVAISIQTK